MFNVVRSVSFDALVFLLRLFMISAILTFHHPVVYLVDYSRSRMIEKKKNRKWSYLAWSSADMEYFPHTVDRQTAASVIKHGRWEWSLYVAMMDHVVAYL